MLSKPTVSVKWLQENSSNAKLIILDASTSVHQDKEDKRLIPNSLNISLKEDFSDVSSDLPNTFPTIEQFENSCIKLGINADSTIIIYDDKGVYTSPRLWWLFKTFGHSNVAVLDGGLPEWIKLEGETALVYSEPEKVGDFTPTLNKSAVLTYEDVLTNSGSSDKKLLDARSKGRFDGVAPEPRASLSSGSIPQSYNLPFSEVLENGKFKSEEDLDIIFKGLVNPEEQLIFSCGSGITACIILLAAELVLPNEKSVFDGSWTEWAIRQELLS
ncbi:MAG: thiosulfate/3-mercaptopyruvate sulfurtransferase [Arenicella sp.]|jgi:thiosulfate/3-mercaptopyruvate sulfurtransferase